MDDAEGLEVGAHGGIDCMHNDVLYLANAHAPQVDLARRLDFRQVAPNGDCDLRGCRFGARYSQRNAWHRQLHHPDGNHRFFIADFDDFPDSTTERFDLHKIADIDLGVFGPFGGGQGLAGEAVELSSLLGGEILDALAGLASRFFALFRSCPQILDGALDLGARFPKIPSRLLSRGFLDLALSLADVFLAFGDPTGAIPRVA